jgi:polysaccharide deacetylase family protein (PEP-CTERM system associated)
MQPTRAAEPDEPDGILTFDVEEYFQVEAARSLGREDWPLLAKRLPASVDRILEMLAEHRSSATFFVLGWVARHEPHVVASIAGSGHEIASHGMDHRMIHSLSREELRRDLIDCKSILEDLTGRKVAGYRAPTFSVTHKTSWAIEAILEAGFEYDCSVFPIHHDRYGVPDAPPRPHIAVGPGDGRILEIPPLTLRRLGVNWPVGGGGYFRLLPRWVIANAIESAAAGGHGAVIYLHPWEFDPDQPPLDMPPLARWRHRVNIRHTAQKLRGLLKEFCFTSVAECLTGLVKTTKETYRYGSSSAESEGSAFELFREKSNASGAVQ